MTEKEDSKSTLLGVLEVNTRDYFFCLLKSKWSGKFRTVEDVKVADNEIVQCWVFFYWFNLHKTVILGEIGKEVRRESGETQELVQWVTNPWLEIICNWMLTQDKQAVSFFLNFAWRLRRLFKPKCSEVYYRQKRWTSVAKPNILHFMQKWLLSGLRIAVAQKRTAKRC